MPKSETMAETLYRPKLWNYFFITGRKSETNKSNFFLIIYIIYLFKNNHNKIIITAYHITISHMYNVYWFFFFSYKFTVMNGNVLIIIKGVYHIWYDYIRGDYREVDCIIKYLTVLLYYVLLNIKAEFIYFYYIIFGYYWSDPVQTFEKIAN